MGSTFIHYNGLRRLYIVRQLCLAVPREHFKPNSPCRIKAKFCACFALLLLKENVYAQLLGIKSLSVDQYNSAAIVSDFIRRVQIFQAKTTATDLLPQSTDNARTDWYIALT